ncbi:hypothetical protein BASA50_001727 [Batrachochytrium salamandrivorans]|uniref:C2H2-type domain-containing protein n=1 Tax=Batrachochytrium salamandrivorans TaxID=1357716 RepID=A0ABQ8FND6_9FUNG|nr:hypothetical protein BASA61_009674 [Batrachochytrium salamandrivorans]KAH6601202.1 hypothetical protein BASA50_001727 [Batrachochytrium salamandrivorans]KAJ1338930.1 hypothetical protein BSLG_006565 [Batrachochytrium salamandrivorans]
MAPVLERAGPHTYSSRKARSAIATARTSLREGHSHKPHHSSSPEIHGLSTGFQAPPRQKRSRAAAPSSQKHSQHSANANAHSHHTTSKSQSTPLLHGFYFKRRRERLNWNLLNEVDLDLILEEIDINALQNIIENITFCDIEAEDLRYIDPSFVKLFQLSQLITEFLLHSQDYLADQRDGLASEIEKTKAQLAETVAINNKQRCTLCSKSFSSECFLDSHMNRRHGAPPKQLHCVPPVLEVPVASTNPTSASSEFQRMADMIERFSTRLIDTERQLRNEAERKMEELISRDTNERKTSFDEMYKQERLRYEKELQEIKASAHQQIDEDRKNLLQEKAIFEEYRNMELKKKSHVGVIEDDDEQVNIRALPVEIKCKNDADQKHDLQREAMALALSAEIDEKQQQTLKAIQESMSKEMDRMQQTILNQQAAERNSMEKRLDSTSLEIHKMHQELIKQQELSNSNSSQRYTTEISKPFVVIEQPQISFPIKNDHESIKVIPNTYLSKTESDVDSEHDSLSSYDGNKTENEMRDEDEKWDAIMSTLQTFKEIPVPSTPWVRSLYQHDFNDIQEAKNNSSTIADQRLAKNQITMSRIYNEWNMNPSITAEYSQLSMKMFQDRFNVNLESPMLGRMRQYLEKQLDSTSALHFEKPSDSNKSVSRRGSIRDSTSSQNINQSGSRPRLIHISPVPHSVEVFDQYQPVLSPTKRNLASASTPGSPLYPQPSSFRQRHVSVATTATDMTETEESLRFKMSSIDENSPLAKSPSTSQSHSNTSLNTKARLMFSNPFKALSIDIAKKLFSSTSPNETPHIEIPPPSSLPTLSAPVSRSRNRSVRNNAHSNPPPPPPPKDYIASPLHSAVLTSESDSQSYDSTSSTGSDVSSSVASKERDGHNESDRGKQGWGHRRSSQMQSHLPPKTESHHYGTAADHFGSEPSAKIRGDQKNDGRYPSKTPPKPHADESFILPNDSSFTLSDISDVSLGPVSVHQRGELNNPDGVFRNSNRESVRNRESKAHISDESSNSSFSDPLKESITGILRDNSGISNELQKGGKVIGSRISKNAKNGVTLATYTSTTTNSYRNSSTNDRDDDILDILDEINSISDLEIPQQQQQQQHHPSSHLLQFSSQPSKNDILYEEVMDDVDEFDA